MFYVYARPIQQKHSAGGNGFLIRDISVFPAVWAGSGGGEIRCGRDIVSAGRK